MRVTIWTFTTDDDGLIVGVYPSEQKARAAWREWAQYYVETMPDSDQELESMLSEEDDAYFLIDSHDIEVP